MERLGRAFDRGLLFMIAGNRTSSARACSISRRDIDRLCAGAVVHIGE
jgi:hypothetical protein